MASLAIKYRPKTFDQVVGQDQAIGYFRQFISQGRLAKHILLFGSVGSGKTTLAKIYAKALNCQDLAADQSPCLICTACQEVESGKDWSRFIEVDAPAIVDGRELKARMASWLESKPKGEERKVIFIDEAHSLRQFGFDIFLKQLEDTNNTGLSFVFATTQPDRFSGAMKSRCFDISVEPLDQEQGVSLLRKVCAQEGIQNAEEEALVLLWRLGLGQPRNMLKELERVRVKGDVTRDAVRDAFAARDVDALIDYAIVLGVGNHAEQMKAFFKWRASIRKKIHWLQSLLVSIYYNDFMGGEVAVDPVIGSIRPAERQPIINAFAARLGNQESLVQAWQTMMRILPVATSNMSEDALLAKVALFQSQVCSPELGKIEQVIPPAYRPIGRKSETSRATGGRPVAKTLLSNPDYLSRDHVGFVYNRASAFVQATGRSFNMRVTIFHDAFGCADQKSAGKNLGRFGKALSDQLWKWFPEYGDRILLHEVTADKGRCGRLIFCLPDAGAAVQLRVMKWIRRWRRDKRSDPKADNAISVEFSPDQEGLQGHWDCVRWLCGGANPTDTDFGHLKIDSRYMRVAGNVGQARRVSASDGCGDGLRGFSAKSKIPFLSAIGAGAWQELYSGWELEVFSSRQKFGVLAGYDSAADIQGYLKWQNIFTQHRGLGIWEE